MQCPRLEAAMVALIGRLAREEVVHHLVHHPITLRASVLDGRLGGLQLEQAFQGGKVDVLGKVTG